MRAQRVAALIPAFNVSEGLSSLIARIQPYVERVIVVDDGSTDDTGETSRRAGAFVIRHSENRGKGTALRTGFEYFIREGYDGCIILDGDGQHDPKDIPIFLREAARSDAGVIIGNRMSQNVSMPVIRRWTNQFMSFILSHRLGVFIPDTQCGFRYIRADVLRVIQIESTRFAIDSEILIEARRHGFKIASVPIQTIYQNQKSNIQPIRDTYFFLRLLFKKPSKKEKGKNG